MMTGRPGLRVSKPNAREEDLLALPENLVGEIVDGDLYALPLPAGPHAIGASALGMVLGPPFQFGHGGGPGGWWIVDEPELHLQQDVLVPDLAGWRRSRMPQVPRDHRFRVPPDWICEVLSPATERLDRSKKQRIYARERVGHLWLLNPLSRTLEVCRLVGDFWTLLATHDGTVPVRVEPFDAIEIDLGLVWLPEDESADTD